VFTLSRSWSSFGDVTTVDAGGRRSKQAGCNTNSPFPPPTTAVTLAGCCASSSGPPAEAPSVGLRGNLGVSNATAQTQALASGPALVGPETRTTFSTAVLMPTTVMAHSLSTRRNQRCRL
jgi:hypothetical protein